MSPYFRTVSLHGQPDISIDPFLNLDHFHMSQPTFPPHPHAGFSAVTYMFEDSEGAFVNRDSSGDRSIIGPGALHWTQAGSGIMHEEVPEHRGTDCHGMQIFVNLAAIHKQTPPRAFRLQSTQVPEVRPAEGARIRVLCGESHGVSSPLTDLLTPVTLLDVHLEPGVSIEHAVPGDHTAFVMGIDGQGHVGPADAAVELDGPAAAIFSNDGSVVRISAGNQRFHVLVGAGRPIGESVVWGGPFAMSTRQEVLDAYARYQAGAMGRLEPLYR